MKFVIFVLVSVFAFQVKAGENSEEYRKTVEKTNECLKTGGKAEGCVGKLTDTNKKEIEKAGLSQQTALDAAAKLFTALETACKGGDETASALCLQEKIESITKAAMKAQTAVGGMQGAAGDAALQKWLGNPANKKEAELLKDTMAKTGLSVSALSNSNP